MRHPASQKLFDYWNSIRRGRPAPERGEIEPSDIRTILGDTFILEVSNKFRTISFRLAGTRLCSAHGRELKGLGYLALWSEEDNYEVALAVSRVYRDNSPVLISYVAKTGNEHGLEYEAVILPLASAADGNARLLGIATPRTTPYWLGTEALAVNHLRNVRQIEPGKAPEIVLPGMQQAAPNRRFGHLTVLDGGKSQSAN